MPQNNPPYYSNPYFSIGPVNWPQVWPANIFNNPDDPVPMPSALGSFGSQVLQNQFSGMNSPVVSRPPLDSGLDLTGLPDLSGAVAGFGNINPENALGAVQNFANSPRAPYAIPFPPGGALPLANDIYKYFAGEDSNAKANIQHPPELEAIIREANANRPKNDSPNVMNFDIGSLPPADLFHASPVGMVGNVDYSQFAKALPGAKRVQREVQPPTDFSAAEAAMNAARPTYEEHGPWGQVLQGLARGALSSRGGDLSEILFSAAMGALGGYGSGMDVENERKDLAKGREQQFNERLAGFDLEKAGAQRTEKQQQSDATYEADVNFNQENAARQQQMISILMHGADQNAENARYNAGIAANTANMNRELALKRFELGQPNVDVNQYGLVVTKVDPQTGKRTMTIDNSPWVQRLQTQAMMRQMGAIGMPGGAELPGMGFTNSNEVDGPELVKRLSTYYFMNPMAAATDLNGGQEGDLMGKMAMQTRTALGGDENSKLFPQMMANNLYSYLAPIISDPKHPLHNAVLARMAQMQGMF